MKYTQESGEGLKIEKKMENLHFLKKTKTKMGMQWHL
jgi:hypothetical protein